VQTQNLAIGARQITLSLVRNLRARRYVLRVRPDGSARVTIPRGGNQPEAMEFVARHSSWIERQLSKPHKNRVPQAWTAGASIFFRGDALVLQCEGNVAYLGNEKINIPSPATDLRPCVEAHLHRLAAVELNQRTCELALQHGLEISRVTVRNQRSRWGSCSRRRTISLNWRLIQVPAFVRDYIILHELMHLREMNHSQRFWKRVEEVCPDYTEAEKWLKINSGLLRQI
jgi:predicted metal-dependent hydrolase